MEQGDKVKVKDTAPSPDFVGQEGQVIGVNGQKITVLFGETQQVIMVEHLTKQRKTKAAE